MVTAERLNMPYYSLKTILAKQDISQKQMAEMLDIDRATFNLKINRTKGRDFDLGEAMTMASILDVKVDDFFA